MQQAAALATIRVELCGRLADLAGREVTVAVPEGGLTVANLCAAIAAAHPALAEPLASGRVRACVNEAIVPASAAATVTAQPTDLVALFPPVSGG